MMRDYCSDCVVSQKLLIFFDPELIYWIQYILHTKSLHTKLLCVQLNILVRMLVFVGSFDRKKPPLNFMPIVQWLLSPHAPCGIVEDIRVYVVVVGVV